MTRTDFARRLCGATLIALGLGVALGWVLREPFAVRLHASYPPMVFSTAICLALGGVAVAMGFGGTTAWRIRTSLLGAAITLIAMLNLAGGFGINLPSLHDWLPGAATPTARSPVASASAFLCVGAFLLLAAQVTARWSVVALRCLWFVVLAIGSLALAGYAVDAPLLFPRYYFAGVALHTAAGLVILAIGLRLALMQLASGRGPLFRHEDDHITAVAAGVLALVAAIAGVSSFAVLQGRTQSVLAESLQSSLGNRVDQIQDLLRLRESAARIAATRPAVISNLRNIRAGHDDGTQLANVRAVVASFLREGFSALAYYDPDGKLVASGGQFASDPQIVVALDLPDKPELLWNGGFVLRHRLPLEDATGKVGMMVAEQPLPVLTRLARSDELLGDTGDMGLCVRSDAQLTCFPQRLNPRVFSTPLVNIVGEALPMTRALRGERGIVVTRDYRAQNVVAAFAPVQRTGLGMVVKIDTAEIFHPIREQLQMVAILLLLLIAAGTFLVRSQVRPLAVKLRKSREELRRVMTGELDAQRAALHRAQVLAGLAHVVTGPDGEFESWSETLPALIGYPESRLPGSTRDWLELIEPVDRERFRATSIRAAQERTRQDVEYRLRRADGRLIDVRQVIEPIPTPGIANSERWFSTLQDVTEQKRAEAAMHHLNADLERRVADRTAELKSANQELESFSYTVSHDLRAPLRAIEGFSRILEQEHAQSLPESSRHLLARVHHNVAVMSELIEDLLAFSRLGRQDLNRVEAPLQPIAESCIAEMGDEIAARGAQVTVGPLPRAKADSSLVTRVFQNLLDNALKYTRNAKPPVIEVGSFERAGESVVFVKDNGVGFDMRYAHKLFNVFQRLHSASEFEGTGVGLAIVQRIVQRHGGRAWAESRAGEGATFYFTLGPKAAAQPERATSGATLA